MSCQVITKEDKKYPKLLKKIGKIAPKQLYYKGSWDDEIFKNCLAVVGSRRMTTYGRQVVEKIVGEAAAQGLTIVSGFMYGVDAASHQAALKVGGKTIAVMPCGIERIHPEYQQDLYVEILNSKGLVISEYEGDAQPAYWTYPQRNRIVAGLSKAALIVEAGEKSGSLITAKWAKKFKRKLFVVPGPITSENSKGIMQLIKEGAIPISSAKDILDFYNLTPGVKQQKKEEFRGIEGEILGRLQIEPMGIDDLARTLGVPAGQMGMTLSMMQLKGIIKQEGSKYYIN